MRALFLFSFFAISCLSFGQTDSTKSNHDDVIIEMPEKANDETVAELMVFRSVQQMPEFPGGEEAMYNFLANNLVYPEAAKENGIQGRVYLEFVVSENGEIRDIRILNKEKLGFGCEQAAIDVIKKMPKWKPGKHNGRPVNVYFTLPFKFKLF